MYRKSSAMRDNSDVQEMHDGKVTDMRMEICLAAIYEGRWNEPSLDTLYTEIVTEFLSENIPTMLVSKAGSNHGNAQGLLYLSLLHLDYCVTHAGNEDWPGTFEFLPQATYAVRIQYEGTGDYTDWTPGVSPSAAAIAAIMQYCREISSDYHNSNGAHRLN